MNPQIYLSVEARSNLLFAIQTNEPQSGTVRDAVNSLQKCAYDDGYEAGRIQAGKEVPILLLQVAQLLEKRRAGNLHDDTGPDKVAIFRMAAEMLAVGLEDMTHLYANNTMEAQVEAMESAQDGPNSSPQNNQL